MISSSSYTIESGSGTASISFSMSGKLTHTTSPVFNKSLALPCSPLMVNPILTRFCFVSSLADKLQYPLKNTFSFDCSHSFGTVNVNALIVIYLCNKKGDSFAVTLMIKRALFYFYSPMHGIFNITPLNSC